VGDDATDNAVTESVVVGRNAAVGAGGSTATLVGHGANSAAANLNPTAVGHGANTTGDDAVAVGQAASANLSSVAVGNAALAGVSGDVAIGAGSIATGPSAIAIGTGASAVANQARMGSAANDVTDFAVIGAATNTFRAHNSPALGFTGLETFADIGAGAAAKSIEVSQVAGAVPAGAFVLFVT
jgi:hypothetical protein